MMNNVSIRAKLLLMLFVPLVLFAASAIYLLQLNSANVNKLTSALYDTGYRSIALVLNADRDMYQAFAAYQELRSRFATDEDKQKAKADFQENVAQTNERIGQALAIVAEEGLSGYAHSDSGVTMEAAIREVDRLFRIWTDEASARMSSNDYSVESETRSKLLFEEARGNINVIGEILETYANEEVGFVKGESRRSSISTFVVLVVEWILLISFGVLLIRKLTRTVALVQSKTRQVAEGYLKYEPLSKYDKDELGKILSSVDAMIGKMRDLIGSIAGHSRQVSIASGELAESAKESAAASGHVAENIQLVTTLVETQSNIARESNVAMEEMAVGVQKIAESTNVISDHSSRTSEMADEGAVMLARLREQMELTAAAIVDLDRSVTVLGEKSDRIGTITERMTAIANQTGILSLNASIEAARAGEHGKGFAVVAHEIRKLAATSLDSAQAIHQLIGDTRDEIGRASAHMRETVGRSEQGASALAEVARGFEAIVESIRQITKQLHDSSAVTEQMSASAEQVSAGLETSAGSAVDIAGKAQNISAATEEQLALSESIASSSERLQDIVGELDESVRYFKL